jgi:hypothetical protein
MLNRAGIIAGFPAGADEVIFSDVKAVRREERTWFETWRVLAGGFFKINSPPGGTPCTFNGRALRIEKWNIISGSS